MTVWIPRPDQRQVLDFIMPRERAAVWAGVGVGKTAMGLHWLLERMEYELCTLRALIVCPPLVCEVWTDNMERWDQFRMMRDWVRVLSSEDFNLARSTEPKTKGELVLRDKVATRRALLACRERIHLVPWSMWPFMREALTTWFPYNDIVFDEASNLRDSLSERGRAARWVARRLPQVRGILELGATPSANHDEAVFGQLDALVPGLLGDNITSFRDVYCEAASKNWKTGQVYSWRVAERMRSQFDAKVASVAISAPSNLGVPLLPVEQPIRLPEAARALYDRLAKDWVLPEHGITCGSEAVLHAKLRQIASGQVYRDDETVLFVHNTKVERLVELVEEIDAPVIVGYEWLHDLERLRGLGGRDINDKGAKADFLAGKLRMLLVQPQSAAHGVDGLQHVCHNVIWFTVPQDLELNIQLNGRAHRTGQEKTVMAHYLIAEGTKDREVYDDVLPYKRARQDLVLTATRVPGIVSNL